MSTQRENQVVEKLAQSEIDSRLAQLPDWSQIGDAISRTFQFKDFLPAIRFVNLLADHAENVQHHPDMLIRYNRVTLTLSTHDVNGLTERDFDFAVAADGLAQQHMP